MAFEIKRDYVIIDGKKHVNVDLIELSVIILLRTNLEGGSSKLTTGSKLYVSPKWTFSKYIKLLEETFKTL